MADIRTRMLGPLTIDETPAADLIHAGKERGMYAALSLRPGQLVQRETLGNDLWDEDPPQDLNATLRTYTTRLRRDLAPDGPEIETRPSAYRLALRPEETDVVVFEQLLEDIPALKRARDWKSISRKMTDAAGLWRGPAPLVDVPSCPLKARWSARLKEKLLLAVRHRITADLHLGLCHEVIPELADLTAENPVDESLIALQMRALYLEGLHAWAGTEFTFGAGSEQG